LILAYQGSGEINKAQQVLAEAEYLFPQQSFGLVAVKPVSHAEETQSQAESQKK
jgi:O-antigen polymerase